MADGAVRLEHPRLGTGHILVRIRHERWMIIAAIWPNGKTLDGLEVMTQNDLTLKSFKSEDEPELVGKEE